MYQILKHIFYKKKLQKNKFDIKFLSLGQFVELEYIDPKKIGIINKDTLTFTRLNKDEIENRIIQGYVERIIENKELKCNMVKIKTFKPLFDGSTKVREYLFLDYEIIKCRVLK